MDNPVEKVSQIENFRHCCHIPCDKVAEYEIVAMRSGGRPAGPDPYSDFTDACTDHVGTLLGYQPDAVEPEDIHWEVHGV